MRFFKEELVVYLDLRLGGLDLQTVVFHPFGDLEILDNVVDVANA